MFGWWGRTVVRARWAVLGGGVLLALIGVVWGTGVFTAVSAGGFDDPGSESSRAAGRIQAELGRQEIDVLALYSSPTLTVDDPGFRDAVTSTVAGLRARAEVRSVVSYYDTHREAFVSRDRHATYAAVILRAPGTRQLDAIRPALPAPGLKTQVGGPRAVFGAVSNQVSRDIGRAELYSMPIVALLLIIVFRSVLAATTPLLVGGLAILGAFTATRAITYVTDVSVFAINIITLVGLGMAVDYALFVVSRFREELDAGRPVPRAVERTMMTAGRTVLVSGVIVMMALASLLIFPEVFLQSMAVGGMAAVGVAMLAALTVLPALLAVLGRRTNALPVRLRRRPDPATMRRHRDQTPGQDWARVAHAVMARPVTVVLVTVALLALLAAPFLRAEFGAADERVLPPGTESRVVAERIAAEFPGGGADHISVLLTGADPAAAARFAADLARVPGVAGAAVTANRGTSWLVSVSYQGGEPGGPAARHIVSRIRDLPPPIGTEVMVAGRAAETVDLLASLGQRLPWMALLVASTTMVLLFLAFGSVVLPVKAVAMNVVSIGASFGAVVWVFQQGHFAGLLGFTPTYLEATQLILMLAILFGLSTDYEVFLLSRVREEWDRTGDNTAAVAAGLQRTGRIITSAAMLLVVVIGGFASGGISFIKMIGLGMIVAISVDATIVRALLVPATMRLLGRANWWAPGPLGRWYRRLHMHQADESGAPEPVPVGPAAEVAGSGA